MDRCCIESIAMMSQKKLFVHPYLSEAVSHNNSKTFTTYINSLKKWFLILIIIISHSHQSRKKFRKIETHILMHPITSYLPILSLFTYLFVVRLSAWFEAKIGRKLTDRRGHHISHGSIMMCARASQSRAIISKMTMMSCCTNRVCYDLFFNNRPIRVGTLYLKFKKEREFQNFSVILFE